MHSLVQGLCFAGRSGKVSFCRECREKEANGKALYVQGVKVGLSLKMRMFSSGIASRLKIGINHKVKRPVATQKDELCAREPNR